MAALEVPAVIQQVLEASEWFGFLDGIDTHRIDVTFDRHVGMSIDVWPNSAAAAEQVVALLTDPKRSYTGGGSFTITGQTAVAEVDVWCERSWFTAAPAPDPAADWVAKVAPPVPAEAAS